MNLTFPRKLVKCKKLRNYWRYKYYFFWRITICALSLFTPISQAETYMEEGKPEDPVSWHSPEFDAQPGLGAINAEQAYAAGYTGKGISIGIFDDGVYNGHDEFFGNNKLVNLTTSGIRLYTDPYTGAQEGEYFYYDNSPSMGINERLKTHGTNVAGVAAGNRDGMMMHGVAFDAQIISAENGDPGPEDGIILGNDGGVYRAGWDALIASGARVINNSWGIGIADHYSQSADPDALHFTVEDARQQFKQIETIIYNPTGGAYKGAIDAVRAGIVNVFAAGNNWNGNSPDALAGLPYFLPDLAANWLTVTGLMTKGFTKEYTLSYSSSRCGYTASFCVSAPGLSIYTSQVRGESLDDLMTGYTYVNGTSIAAPHVTGSIAVLMQRYPYMTGAQIVSVLKTTATDMGVPGIDDLYGWGMIDLGKAIYGPGMLYTADDIPEEFRIPGANKDTYGSSQFTVTLPGQGAFLEQGKSSERVCEDIQCGFDVWSNDISGHGGLSKEGVGTLVLTGHNTYTGPTIINQGRLMVTGSVTSDVSVQNSGVLTGDGAIESLTVNKGGVVAPDNPDRPLRVNSNIIFNAGSRYALVVTADGRSSRIESAGTVSLQGGQVTVSRNNSHNLLSEKEVRTLINQQYVVLTAENGINGQYDSVVPNYLFLGTVLKYQPNQIILNVGRNLTSFDSVAQTPAQRTVAAAADTLPPGNPVYESIISLNSVSEARNAFHQLSGQVHANIAQAQLVNSHYLRDTLNERLKQAEGTFEVHEIKTDNEGAWIKAVSAWSRNVDDLSITDYRTSTEGLLLGTDSANNNGLLGIATGFTRTRLYSGYRSGADNHSFHLAMYGNKQSGNFTWRAGAAYSGHRIHSHRSVKYGKQSDNLYAHYTARTQQVFLEGGYTASKGSVNLEPFAGLAYINMRNGKLNEKGGASGLQGDKQQLSRVISTSGLRAGARLPIRGDNASVSLMGELAWQHKYANKTSQINLKFSESNKPFVVNSAADSADAVVLKMNAAVAFKKSASLSVGYSGVISRKYQDNSINAGLTWHF